MRREIVCFSLYSLISIRVIAFASWNKNSDNALAVSVLPTPVGPRNRKLPIFRSEDVDETCKFVRANRTQFAMAVNTWSCPTTRCRNVSSICNNWYDSLLPVLIRDTGIPVCRATIVAITSAVTESANIFFGCVALLSSISMTN